MQVRIIKSTEQRGILTIRDPKDGTATTVRVKWTEELRKLGVRDGEVVEMTFSKIAR